MSSVTVYTRLCMMYLEVYTSSIHESSACVNVCEYMHTSRLDDMMMRVSRLDSYAHTIYEIMNDDESLD